MAKLQYTCSQFGSQCGHKHQSVLAAERCRWRGFWSTTLVVDRKVQRLMTRDEVLRLMATKPQKVA